MPHLPMPEQQGVSMPSNPEGAPLQCPASHRRAAPQPFQVSLAADHLAVRDALRTILAQVVAHIPADDAGTLELLLAEILNNIVEHGSVPAQAAPITVSVDLQKHALACEVCDPGIALPEHLLVPPPPAAAPYGDHLPEGGFGWPLIHDLAHNLTYRRAAGRNRLSFSLPLTRGPSHH